LHFFFDGGVEFTFSQRKLQNNPSVDVFLQRVFVVGIGQFKQIEFTNYNEQQNNRIDDSQGNDVEKLIRQGVDNRHPNGDKEIGHFFGMQGFGAVANDPKNGKEPQGHTQI